MKTYIAGFLFGILLFSAGAAWSWSIQQPKAEEVVNHHPRFGFHQHKPGKPAVFENCKVVFIEGFAAAAREGE